MTLAGALVLLGVVALLVRAAQRRADREWAAVRERERRSRFRLARKLRRAGCWGPRPALYGIRDARPEGRA